MHVGKSATKSQLLLKILHPYPLGRIWGMAETSGYKPQWSTDECHCLRLWSSMAWKMWRNGRGCVCWDAWWIWRYFWLDKTPTPHGDLDCLEGGTFLKLPRLVMVLGRKECDESRYDKRHSHQKASELEGPNRLRHRRVFHEFFHSVLVNLFNPLQLRLSKLTWQWKNHHLK